VRKGKRVFLVLRDADGLDTLLKALGKRREGKIRPSGKEGMRDIDYLALLQFLNDLLANSRWTVDEAEVKRCIPGIAGSEFDSAKLRIECL
jgi:hypothetical protein